MKTFLFSLLFLFTTNLKAQTLNSIVANHVFVMCDQNAIPMDLGDGIHVFMVFHSNGVCNMLMGSDLTKAIDFGAQKTGKWLSDATKVAFTWNDTGKGNTWYRNGISQDLKSADGNIIKNLGGF